LGFRGDLEISGGYWSDSYLAAFAIVAGMRLVTFDKGFGSVDGLDSLMLSG
jgi:predicted nucleic acid-binding protein